MDGVQAAMPLLPGNHELVQLLLPLVASIGHFVTIIN